MNRPPLSWLRTPTACALLGFVILFEIYSLGCSHRGCYLGKRVSVVRGTTGLQQAGEDATEDKIVGEIMWFPGPWTRAGWPVTTSRRLDPSFTFVPSAGNDPDPADEPRLRAICADVVEHDYLDPDLATVIRANNGPVTKVTPLAYVINAIPLLPLVAFLYSLLWIPDAIREGRRRRDEMRGLCANCGYPRRGLGWASPCPECGTAPRS